MQLTYNNKTVILIEFWENEIVRILNNELEVICFYWSKKLNLYLVSSQTDDCVSGNCWVHKDYQNIVKEKFSEILNIELPTSLEFIQSQLDEACGCEETIYCKVCESAYCREDFYHKHGGDYCAHINWCDELGEFAGCGYSEDEWDSYKESFFKLLDAIKDDVSALKYSLSIHQYYFEIKNDHQDYSVYAALLIPGETSMRDGLWNKTGWRHEEKIVSHKYWGKLNDIPDIAMAIFWLSSLWSVNRFGDSCDETPTTLADETTIAWIEEWELLQKIETTSQQANK
ncbi:MAG: hypothetical protein RLZZ203_1144 [Cyanobacteriota bacterium]|jgi:hypothetical protein